MRLLLIIVLIALAGCATRAPGPDAVEWNVIAAHPGGTPSPRVENGQLTLSGRAIRSSGIYEVPVTIECDVQPQQASTNSTFYIDLVPQSEASTTLPVDYIGIKLVHDQEIHVWKSKGSQPTALIKRPIRANPDGGYKLFVEARRDGLTVRVNDQTFTVNDALPFNEFRIELRTFPPASEWDIRNFSVR